LKIQHFSSRVICTAATGFLNLKTMPENTGRILALDLGKKRVGVAVCDELRMTVRGVLVLERKSLEKLQADVQSLIADFDAQALVIGLPLNFDGTESQSSQQARAIARELAENISIPVFLQDERLTSREAEEILRQQGFDWKTIKKLADKEAAAIILRDFLAEHFFSH
jgi:putative Holliday junction resolvase